jgi:hypothetical protein
LSDVGGEVYLPTVVQKMVDEGHKFRALDLEYFYDCGTLEGLEEARGLFG